MDQTWLTNAPALIATFMRWSTDVAASPSIGRCAANESYSRPWTGMHAWDNQTPFWPRGINHKDEKIKHQQTSYKHCGQNGSSHTHTHPSISLKQFLLHANTSFPAVALSPVISTLLKSWKMSY